MDIRSDRQNGLSYTELGRKYHMDPRTAKRYAESPERPEYTLSGPKPTKLDVYKQLVDEWLEEAPYSAIRILEKLREMGFDGGYSIVKAYVSSRKMDLDVKATVRFETMPGKQGQMDWGFLRITWYNAALNSTSGADIVFLDPDNGLETAKMHQCSSAKDKHTTWREVKDYYDRGQSVILYQHRPQMMKKENCIRSIFDFQHSFLMADNTFLLEYPRYTNRYYFIFCHHAHQAALESVCKRQISHRIASNQRV